MRWAAMVMVAGCSFAFTNAPEPAVPGELPVCTTGYAPVIADAIGSVPPFVVGGYLGIASLSPHEMDASTARTIAWPALAIGAGFVVAAFYGRHNIAACDDAIDDAMLVLARHAEAGDCDPVIAFAKRLARRDVASALLFVHGETFARCFN